MIRDEKIRLLRCGDLFVFKGKTYKAGHVIDDDIYDYVACTDINTHKATKLFIDIEVEPYKAESEGNDECIL